MKLPKEYFEYDPCDVMDLEAKRRYHTLRGLADWVESGKIYEIEMSKSQFWHFTCLQPLHAGEERYWTTFHGIPLRCPEMTVDQQKRLGIALRP